MILCVEFEPKLYCSPGSTAHYCCRTSFFFFYLLKSSSSGIRSILLLKFRSGMYHLD